RLPRGGHRPRAGPPESAEPRQAVPLAHPGLPPGGRHLLAVRRAQVVFAPVGSRSTLCGSTAETSRACPDRERSEGEGAGRRLPTEVAPLRLYGQEINAATFAMARMNAFIHDMEADIQAGAQGRLLFG